MTDEAKQLTPGFHVFPGVPSNSEDGPISEFYWHLVAANGKVLCVSEGYTTREHAQEGVEAAERACLAAQLQADDPTGWQGTDPAQGTRRRLVREVVWETIKGWDLRRTEGEGYAGATGSDALVIADAVETALVRVDTIGKGAADGS